MLISQTAKVKWNSRNKKYYVDLGYIFTKMGEEFDVNVDDLTPGSNSIVNVQCDYCGRIYTIKWEVYKRLKKKTIALDCCGNSECTTKKSKQTIKEKYNVDSIRELDFVNEKIKNTNIEKYGCENPFGNKNIQNKIKQYYIDNFGVEYDMQIKENVEKVKNTCLERYGVENYSQTAEFRDSIRGENSPVWKGDKAVTVRNGRELPEYRDWRKGVFSRDLYTCQCCGARNGHGKYVRLEAHHIKDWKNNINDRYNLDNGVTLCQECHILFHSLYGKKGNDQSQYDNFIMNFNNIDEKIC